MNRKVEIMFDKENRQREAKKRLKEKQLALVNGSKKMVVVGATTLVLAGAFSCSQASAYDRYDDNSYRGLGYMCFSDEVGSDGDGSYVSPGTGDYGGISYGLYQFSTTTGSAKDFVNWSKDNNYPEIYKIFQDAGNPKAGTPAFGKAWKKCYRELEGKFEEAQTEFAMGELINPGYEKVKKETGIDLKKSRARTEFLISTANQFGRGGIVTLFKEVQNKGIKLSDDMNDTELLGIMCQHKYDTVDYHFRSSSSAVQRSARLRFKREKKELLKIAKEEEGPKLDEIDTNKEQTEATKTETSSSKTSKKEVVNDTADKYQGKGITYDFGEKNYKSGSLDCSGLISQMMNDMGVKVDAGNTNALKFSNDSKKISKDEVQPGDLVFWNDDNGSRHNSVYHIGMYVGNDTIVDCSPSHNGVGTRKLSQCKDTGDMHYTYGRYTKLENKMKDYAQKIVESIDEFDDVITVDDSNIEKDYKKVEEKTIELKEAINENAKEDKSEESSKEDNNQKEESSKEDKSEETSKEDREDNKEDNNVQEENKKDNETSLDKSEDASNKDEFESIIDEDKTDKSEEENNKKEESSKEDKEETSNESNESSKEDKTEESSEDKEETNDSTLDKTLVVGDSHAKALEDKLKDNKDTEVEATVGASAYVYLNDTNYFGDKLIDKLPKDSDKINKVIISLGVNNIEGNSNINDVKKVIDKIESMYPGKDIYFMKVNHVGDKYKDGDVDKTNKMIDDLNKEIENYVKDKDKVKVLDASKGLETEGKLTETSDGLHVKDNDKLIDNLEKGIEENKKDNETSLDKSEDSSNKDEFESIIDEDKTDKSVETSKEEDKSNENNQKEESSKEDKSEETSKEDKEEDSSNKEESAVEKEETSNEDNNVQEENNQKEKTIESSKEDKSEESSKEEDVVEKEESSKEDNNVQEENNQKEETTVDKQEETTESSNKEESAVEKEESSNEDKSEESSKEDNNVQESTKETSNEDKEENVVKEQKETSKEEDKSEVKQTVQDKSNESSKEEKPVVEEQKSVNNNQESATETSKEDNSESQKENSRVDELHSRLQNNLFGRILMG